MIDVDPAAVKAFHRVRQAAAKASARYAMLQPGDRVAAALSGGLDSLVMLETLIALQKRAPFDFELEAVTFDPGFPDYNLNGIAEYCKMREVRHSVIAVNVPEMLEKSPQDRFRRPCVLCSRLRRGKLYGFARENKFNKIALGHHADDLMESLLISLVRGQGITTMGPNVTADTANEQQGDLRIIRPLALIDEKTVKCAAGSFEFPIAGKCPYQAMLDESGDRAWAKRCLSDFAQRIPDLHTLMLKSMSKVEANYLLDKRFLDIEQ